MIKDPNKILALWKEQLVSPGLMNAQHYELIKLIVDGNASNKNIDKTSKHYIDQNASLDDIDDTKFNIDREKPSPQENEKEEEKQNEGKKNIVLNILFENAFQIAGFYFPILSEFLFELFTNWS